MGVKIDERKVWKPMVLADQVKECQWVSRAGALSSPI